MTKSEVENSLPFRLFVKSIKKEFPFILDVKFTDSFNEDVNQYEYVYFPQLIVSNNKIMEEYPDWNMYYYMKEKLEDWGEIDRVIFLLEVYTTDDSISPSVVQKELDEFCNDFQELLQRQKAIPEEYKLTRKIGYSGFKILP